MKSKNIARFKQEEARQRMSAVIQARRNPRLKNKLQKRACLVGGAAKWKILNLEQSFAAMAKWAGSAQ